MRVLVLGSSSWLGKLVARQLAAGGHEVIGLDRRPWVDPPDGIETHCADILKREAEDVFRTRKPQVVVHMATVTWLAMRGEERHRVNLGGTRAVFEYCERYGVEHMMFVGRHSYYGAATDSPMVHTEDEPPQGLATFPELADLVAADLYAATALWRMPKLTTTILRICYTLGPSGQGTLAAFLRARQVPLVLGFDPLFQFMHEDDAAGAIVTTLEKRIRGVYNVAGPQPLPLSIVVRETGRKAVELPEFVFSRVIGHFGFPQMPRGATTHIKYPVLIDGSAFSAATGFRFNWEDTAILRQFRELFPPPHTS